jgi:mono/diheme cytochrome c family protein
MRGQVELGVIMAAIGPDKEKDLDVEDYAKDKLDTIWTAWLETKETPILVGPVPSYAGKPVGQLSADERKQLDDSIRRGYTQFTTGTAVCRSCHNDFGRANDFKYDTWGTVVRPANLTAGIYRGGRRPLDLYYRIHSGINGSQMPSYGPTRDKSGTLKSGTLTSEEIWDIVNFLDAMPYKKMLPADVREQVWGKDRE